MDDDQHTIQHNVNGVLWSPAWLGKYPKLYQPESWRPAENITVCGFRQIYIWPLVLRLDTNLKDTLERVDLTGKTLTASESRWKRVKDLMAHLPKCAEAEAGAEARHSYAEFVYFHDFIQSILFPAPAPAPAPDPNPDPDPDSDKTLPVRLYQRSDIISANITIDDRIFTPQVERCNLYLFRSGVAVLAVELNFTDGCQHTNDSSGTPHSITLADVQNVIDKARRSYAPFYDNTNTPRLVPSSFSWQTADNRLLDEASSLLPEWKDALKQVSGDHAGHRTAPMFRHWRDLLAPLRITGYDEAKMAPDTPSWRHIVDERIPVLSFISLTGAAGPGPDATDPRQDLRLVSRGDWIRLCYADSPGRDPLPYAPSFLESFEDAACYDRYFPSEATDSAARYLFAGYHTAVVGAGGFCDDVLVHHVRRHYFQMGLLLNMELASLLSLSSRISAAVHALKSQSLGTTEAARKNFQAEILQIEQEFLEFVHAHHFTGLSNQIQAQEMFAKWRKALNIEAIFADLKDEITTAANFALAHQQVRQADAANKLAQEQARQADAANNLSTLATLGVVLGLAFSFLGMNVMFDSDTINALLGLTKETPLRPRLLRQLVPLGGTLTIFGGLGWGVLYLFLRDDQSARHKTVETMLKWIIGAGGVLLAVGLIAVVISYL